VVSTSGSAEECATTKSLPPPDQPRAAVVAAQVVADLLPQGLEGSGGAGEVDAGQPWVIQSHVGDQRTVAEHQVDHSGRQPGRFEQLHRHVRGRGLRRRCFPQHRVAHQGRRGRQVAGNRGEIERGNRVDEALERTEVDPVLHPWGRSADPPGSAGRTRR
jgi:hypothetical protein